MRKILSTAAALLVMATFPLAAQEAAGGQGGQADVEGAQAGGVTPNTGLQADTDTSLTVQRENAARTEVPPVRGAETTPTPGAAQQAEAAGETGAVAGETDADVTQRAGIETERETTTEYEAGGAAMPQTASALPLLIGLGAALAAAGLGLRLASRSR